MPAARRPHVSTAVGGGSEGHETKHRQGDREHDNGIQFRARIAVLFPRRFGQRFVLDDFQDRVNAGNDPARIILRAKTGHDVVTDDGLGNGVR